MRTQAPVRNEARRAARTGRCGDLRVTLYGSRARAFAASLADLSLTGMGVRDVGGIGRRGDLLRFELCGTTFAWTGTARLVHCARDRAGLAIVSWDGQARRAFDSLVGDRVLASAG